MSRPTFFLKPMDEGLALTDTGNKITIPEGKTTIGRGSFLSCSEKRVSRSHAVLEVTEGELFIIPTHVNPCFYYEKGLLEPLVVLPKNEPTKLEPGDQISLLPESMRFEVCMEAIAKQQKSLENGDVENESGKEQRPNVPKPTDLNSSNEGNETTTKMLEDSHAESENEELSKSKPTSRTLPSWMVEADDQDLVATAKPASKTTAPKKRQDVQKTTQEDIASFFPISSDDDETSSTALSKPKNREKKKPQNTVKHDISDDDSAEEPKSKIDDEKTASTSKRKHLVGDDGLEIKKRKPCEFGKKCYRKNPTHFKECSHPGDEDYTSDAEEGNEDKSNVLEGDDRPECEFGIDCYRKNPSHRKEYKHTKKPQRRAAREGKRKAATRNVDSDEDSFDSSFLDDDDSNDDSNYSPDDEDLKTLKREAREFTSNKKLYEMK